MLTLSNSAVDKYEICPKLFKYHYIDNIRSINTTTALIFGSAIDESVDILLKENNIDKSKEVFLDLLSKGFKKADNNIHIYKKDYDWNTLDEDDVNTLNQMEDSREKELEYAYRSLRGKGLIFLDKLKNDFIEDLDCVVDSQIKVSVKNNEYKIIGFIDFILKMKDGSILLIDLKTSSTSYSDKKLTESGQLHLYDFCIKRMKERGDYKGELPEKIGYLVLRKDFNTKGQMRDIQFKTCEVDDNFSLQVMNRFDTLIENIESNKFNKTEKKYNCTKQFGKKCEYYELCQLNKPLEDIDHLVNKEKK